MDEQERATQVQLVAIPVLDGGLAETDAPGHLVADGVTHPQPAEKAPRLAVDIDRDPLIGSSAHDWFIHPSK